MKKRRDLLAQSLRHCLRLLLLIFLFSFFASSFPLRRDFPGRSHVRTQYTYVGIPMCIVYCAAREKRIPIKTKTVVRIRDSGADGTAGKARAPRQLQARGVILSHRTSMIPTISTHPAPLLLLPKYILFFLHAIVI